MQKVADDRIKQLAKGAEHFAKLGDEEAAKALLYLMPEKALKVVSAKLGLSVGKKKNSGGFVLGWLPVLLIVVLFSSISAFAAYSLALMSFSAGVEQIVLGTNVAPTQDSVIGQPTAASTEERIAQFEATQAALFQGQTQAAIVIQGTEDAIRNANPLQQTQDAVGTKFALTATATANP